uniref:AlNc14C92G5717 protein n=1 Tax=Albugo laibachii Nc14 TaxID=890382 RepID=F0WGI3_9STRA|nr:AlNc14C92G5717 [Albugo laibachii Nc14]|eukprot:CCA20347.1 AlNc14C92G5717 [Albugo laibachii Nc14]
MCVKSLAIQCTVIVYYLAKVVKTQTPADIKTFVPKLRTTYCWEIKRSVDASLWDDTSAISEQRESNACPIQLQVGIGGNDATELFVDQDVSLTWTATVASWSSGSLPLWLGGSSLYTTDATQSIPYVQITASNVKSCHGGSTICSPFVKGDQFQETAEQHGNFSAQKAIFSTNSESFLKFSSPGSYLVFARVTIPGSDANTNRYDFVSYVILAIQNGSGDTVSNGNSPSIRPSLVSSKRGPSDPTFTSTIIALFVIFGVVVLLLLALMCFLKFKIGNDKEAIEIELLQDREKIHQERRKLRNIRDRQRDTRPGAFLSASLLMDSTLAGEFPPSGLAYVGISLSPATGASSAIFEASSGDGLPDGLLPALSGCAEEKKEGFSASKESKSSSYSSAFVDPGFISTKASRERGTIDIGSFIENRMWRNRRNESDDGSWCSRSFSSVEEFLHLSYYSTINGTYLKDAKAAKRGSPLVLDELLDQRDANTMKRKLRQSIS